MKEIKKRKVVSSAKLKLLEGIVHIPSQFFKKKSYSYAIQIDLPWQLLAFPLLVQKIFNMDGLSFNSSFTPVPESHMLLQRRDSMWFKMKTLNRGPETIVGYGAGPQTWGGERSVS